MEPFAYVAVKAGIADTNPTGIEGFEFVQFALPQRDEARALFAR